MKVGIALNMLCQEGRSDASVVGEHLAMGDLAEPLGLRLAVRARASFHRLCDVAGADPAVVLLRRPHQAHHPRHRGHRAAVARSGAGRRADRAPRHLVRRALPVRLWPRRGERRVRGVPHPMGEARPRFVEAAQIIVKALASRTSSGRASSSRSRAPRSGRGRSRIPSSASTPRRSARTRPRSWPSSASAS